MYVKSEKNELKDWFNQVKSPSFTCPQTECQAVNDENTIPLVKVVECTTQGAIYEYDFKVNVKSYNNCDSLDQFYFEMDWRGRHCCVHNYNFIVINSWKL